MYSALHFPLCIQLAGRSALVMFCGGQLGALMGLVLSMKRVLTAFHGHGHVHNSILLTALQFIWIWHIYLLLALSSGHALPLFLVGPPLTPNTGYNIFGDGICRVTNASNPMVCPPGNSSATTPEAQVFVSRPDGGSGPILPGDTVYWRSVATGKYCRSVDPPGAASYIACDLDSPTPSSVITYTGSGFSYQGRPFIGGNGTSPAYFGNNGQQVPPVNVTRPPLPANTPFNMISRANGTAYYVRNDNTTSAAYVWEGTGLTKPEQYIAQDPANPSSTAPIPANMPVLLKSLQTGLYCR